MSSILKLLGIGLSDEEETEKIITMIDLSSKIAIGTSVFGFFLTYLFQSIPIFGSWLSVFTFTLSSSLIILSYDINIANREFEKYMKTTKGKTLFTAIKLKINQEI